MDTSLMDALKDKIDGKLEIYEKGNIDKEDVLLVMTKGSMVYIE